MCFGGNMWCGKDDIPQGYNSTKVMYCSYDMCEKRSIKLPFPNEGGSKMKDIVMWHEKDVAFK
jgi:hypothetical protein